jgi:integrase/recombinase XerD
VLELASGFPADDYWFPGNGAPHIDGRSVSSTLSHAMSRAGIAGHRPHQLRAWHATELIRAGVDAVTVQHSMRHATLGTLHKYIHPDAADVRSALELLPRIDGD